MMKNTISAIAAAALGSALLVVPVAAQQQGMQPSMTPGMQPEAPPSMQPSMSMAGFNVPVEPVRVNILDSFGYYQVTSNGNLVLYLVRGLPSTAAMQGILAMFGQGNPYDTRGFYQIVPSGELVLYPPANLTGIVNAPGMVSMFGMPRMGGMYGMPGMYGMGGMYGMPGGWAAPVQPPPRR